jgi:hypothetical protein
MPTSIDGNSQSNQNFWDSLVSFATQSQVKVFDLFQNELTSEIDKNSSSSSDTSSQVKTEITKNLSLKGLVDSGLETLGITKNESGERVGLLSDVSNWFEGTKAGKWLLGSTPTSSISAAAGTTATAAAGGTTAASSVLTNGEAVTSAAFGVYDLVKNFGKMTLEHGVTTGAITGASIGSFFGGPLVGGVIGAAVGGLISLFKNSGKPKEQKERDQMRKALQQAGIIDGKFTIGLADGSRYDIGIDGKAKAEFGGRKPFEIDQQDQLAVSTFRVFSELALKVTGGQQQLATALAGYLTNASLSNAGGDQSKVQENMRAIIAQFSGVMKS